jgi:hypothetical protein
MKRFWAATLLFALAQFVFYQLIEAFNYLIAHFPPTMIRLDPIILLLTWVESALVAPKTFLRWLIPRQTTPGWLNWILTVCNCLVWGAALAGFKKWQAKGK